MSTEPADLSQSPRVSREPLPKVRGRRRGERHPGAKLTEVQVRAIRATYAAGGMTHRSLAAAFGVSPVTICFILQRRTWKHVK